MLFFWKKDRTKKVLYDLFSIRNRIRDLKEFEAKRDETIAIIKIVNDNIEKAETDMLSRAKEEISKPWLDRQYDIIIDKIAEQEIQALRKLAKDLGDYEQMVLEVKDISQLDDVLSALEHEVTAIEDREKKNKAQIEELEKQTLKQRLRTASAKPPALKTLDGTPWKKIANVVMQFGGWLECGKVRHQCHIHFHNIGPARPIVLSPDVGCELLAEEIKQQLFISDFPKYKIPNTTQIKNALRAGDIYHAL